MNRYILNTVIISESKVLEELLSKVPSPEAVSYTHLD